MIGIFDSGIGGLILLAEIKKKFPKNSIIYLGDLAHLPYGNKSPETIKRLSLQNAKFLVKKGAKIIIIACNSASAQAAPHLKREFRNILIIDVITPTIEAAKAGHSKRIGIIGTRATIASNIYPKKLKGNDREIFTQACPLLVHLIEEGWINRPETKKILRYYLRPLKQAQIDTLILACTHYPLLEKQIQQVMGKKVKLINSAQVGADKLAKVLKQNPKIEKKLNKNGKMKFFMTDFQHLLPEISRRFLGTKVSNVTNINLDSP